MQSNDKDTNEPQSVAPTGGKSFDPIAPRLHKLPPIGVCRVSKDHPKCGLIAEAQPTSKYGYIAWADESDPRADERIKFHILGSLFNPLEEMGLGEDDADAAQYEAAKDAARRANTPLFEDMPAPLPSRNERLESVSRDCPPLWKFASQWIKAMQFVTVPDDDSRALKFQVEDTGGLTKKGRRRVFMQITCFVRESYINEDTARFQYEAVECRDRLYDLDYQHDGDVLSGMDYIYSDAHRKTRERAAKRAAKKQEGGEANG